MRGFHIYEMHIAVLVGLAWCEGSFEDLKNMPVI